MRGCSLILAALFASGGCFPDDSAVVVPPPGIQKEPFRPNAPPAAPAQPQPSVRARPNPNSLKQWNNSAALPEPAPSAQAPAQEATPAPAVEAEKPRDLGEELHTILAGAGRCFASRPPSDHPNDIQFSASATVMPSGLITRAEINGSGLSPAESACLHGIVIAARFRDPVDNAPTTVQTSIQLRGHAAKAPAPSP